MALTEKKTREWWTIYEKWAVVEALLGSGMSITEYCRDRAQYGLGGRKRHGTQAPRYTNEETMYASQRYLNKKWSSPEMTHRLYIKNSLY